MSLDTTEAIYEEFRTATREHLMAHLHHKGDWQHFNEIVLETNQRIEQENADWKQNYHTRLAEAKQIILREAHGNILEDPKLKGVESVPDKKALDLKADTRIRLDHHSRIATIKQDELDRYQELSNLIRSRERLKDYAKSEFEQVRQPQQQSRSGPSRS